MQNRAAQRNFRERQKEYILDLERQVERLKAEISRLHDNYHGLLKATVAPRISQRARQAGQMLPACLDELEYGSLVDGLDSRKAVVDKSSLFPVGLNPWAFYTLNE